MLRLAEAVAAGYSPSDTCTVKLDEPISVGVPETTPVVAFKLRPAGKLPCVTLHA
jgi:hypothetical protein